MGKIVTFVRHVLHEAPTLLAELAAWFFIASWSFSLLMFHTSPLPGPIAQTFEAGPYYKMAAIGAALAMVQLVAMVSLEERSRSACSFAAAIWLGGLATSLIAGDARVPSGLGYIGLAFLCLLAYWRVHPRLLLTIASGAVRLLRGRDSNSH
jgi:hypothetical protein